MRNSNVLPIGDASLCAVRPNSDGTKRFVDVELVVKSVGFAGSVLIRLFVSLAGVERRLHDLTDGLVVAFFKQASNRVVVRHDAEVAINSAT